MSGIMLTLLGSTFGGAKNFIATFNDEDNARQTRSCAVCTDSNDNIYVSAAMFAHLASTVLLASRRFASVACGRRRPSVTAVCRISN